MDALNLKKLKVVFTELKTRPFGDGTPLDGGLIVAINKHFRRRILENVHNFKVCKWCELVIVMSRSVEGCSVGRILGVCRCEDG